MKKEVPTFWVTNISNRNVSLADLDLTIPAFTSVNLLNKRHYQYNAEQLEKSEASGSIFAKRDKIKKRQTPPAVIKVSTPILQETHIPSRERSTLNVKEEHYEELQVTDEEYLKEEESSEETKAAPSISSSK